MLKGQHVDGTLLRVYCLRSLVLMPYHSILVGDSGMGRPSPFSSEIKVGSPTERTHLYACSLPVRFHLANIQNLDREMDSSPTSVYLGRH